MEIRIRTSGLVVDEFRFREFFPNTSLPSELTLDIVNGLGADIVYVLPPPAVTKKQIAVKGTPVKDISGAWVQSWTIAALPQDQIDAQRAIDIAAKEAAIKAERDRRKLNGVFVSGKWIHTDTYSRTQWIAMFVMGENIPAIPWTTMDYSTITTSQALAAQVFSAVTVMDSQVFSAATAHINAMKASVDPSTYDFSIGWPETFKG